MGSDLLYRIGITLLPGIGDKLARNLISYCGGVEEVFKTKKSHLLKIPGIGSQKGLSVLAGIEDPEVLNRAEREVEFIEQNGIQPIFYLDNNYPIRLKECADAPVLLYYKGNADLNNVRVVSIVGTRNATDYGRSVTESIVADLKPYNVLILSGLAYGVDIAAHRAAVKEGIPTVGVLAHGLDRVYPYQHRHTAEDMTAKGGLITEFPSETNPDRENFPKRNRVVAGMADAVIVVESDIKGGSLITANIASSYNRDVFAVPGRIFDKYSRGCNFLLHSYRAEIFAGVAEFVQKMGWDDAVVSKQPVQLNVLLNDEEQVILNLFKEQQEWDIDQMVQQLSINTSKLAASLLELEFKGLVKSLPGKRYARYY